MNHVEFRSCNTNHNSFVVSYQVFRFFLAFGSSSVFESLSDELELELSELLDELLDELSDDDADFDDEESLESEESDESESLDESESEELLFEDFVSPAAFLASILKLASKKFFHKTCISNYSSMYYYVMQHFKERQIVSTLAKILLKSLSLIRQVHPQCNTSKHMCEKKLAHNDKIYNLLRII